jgi:hypothetical protein
LGDFSASPWYKDASLANPTTFQATQYDQYGERLYRAEADKNGDGVVTQEEKYNSYLNYVKDVVSFRSNYQTPRSAFFGMMINF